MKEPNIFVTYYKHKDIFVKCNISSRLWVYHLKTTLFIRRI